MLFGMLLAAAVKERIVGFYCVTAAAAVERAAIYDN
jgi:hypothetical protein